jgi:subtilisin-like proprotein convertase family protein
VAGAARLASWPVFNLRGDITDDEALADMFRHQAQTVAVQNHSWGNSGEQLGSPSLLEQAALDDVLANGRGGRGVVIVRSGGNSRELGGNVNYDSYPSDPRVIAVAAIREDGRAASYSNPGACLLLGAPSGDQQDDFSQGRTIFTTDRVGSSAGYNQISFADDRADYAFGAFGFSGTSAAAPMISGVAALMLSVNTNLTVRDVQQVLIHAARQPGAADPTRQTNGAGHVASHNAGFGVPDAWQAVDLARRWSNRPPVTERRRTWAGDVFIPDDGLRVVATVDGVEFSHRCQPALGRHPEATTADLPLASVGRALTPPAADLRGRAALIERGGNFFYEKINHVAAAGAALAVIFNNVNAAEVFVPGGTDWTDIPAVMIGEDDGRALLAAVEAGSTVSLRLNVEDARLTFDVPDTLVLEHVGLRVRTTHQRRGDLRITLVSPAGTRSVLQALGSDFEAGPDDWTFWSTQHFYEGSAGLWTAQFVDEDSGPTGSVTELELILRGVAITDADRDGLDDAWERRWFGGLAQGPRDDPDGDGSWNAREQALGTDPTRADRPFAVELARHDATRWRLTWPARDGDTNQVRGGSSVIGPGLLETVTGRFPETEAIVPADGAQGFFQVSR